MASSSLQSTSSIPPLNILIENLKQFVENSKPSNVEILYFTPKKMILKI
jgi:hypothetical protein